MFWSICVSWGLEWWQEIVVQVEQKMEKREGGGGEDAGLPSPFQWLSEIRQA